MNQPLVSILICSHNRRELLERAIRSALSQRYPNTEVVVVDDGSTDGSADMVRELFGHRVRCIFQENQGVTATRNRAAAEARGEFIAWLDDDDLMPENRITSLLEALREFPDAVFASGDLICIDGQDRIIGRRWMPGDASVQEPPVLFENGLEAVLWPKVPSALHTTLIRRRAGDQVGWFDPSFRYAAEDADLLTRLAGLGPVAYVREIVSLYRIGHGSLTRDQIRTELARIALWRKHRPLLAPAHTHLMDRLEDRILGAAIRIERLSQVLSVRLADEELQCISTAVSELSPRRRIRYAWNRYVRLPARALIKGDGQRS